MSTHAPDVSALNSRRRRAVQLRVDGLSLSQIQAATGLSVPTIIKAYQAFEQGGWQAIDVAARGRPRGSGRVLDAAQEAALRQAALTQPPETAGLPAGLWDTTALQALARQRWGLSLEPRALSRLLERWGLALHSLADAAPQRGPGADWLREGWPALQREARAQHRKLLWVGALAHHSGAPAGAGILVALTPRGSLRWLPVERLSALDGWRRLFERLAADPDGPWLLALHGPDLRRAPTLTAWLATQPALALQDCPIAPIRRAAAEAPPVTNATTNDPPRAAPAANIPSFDSRARPAVANIPPAQEKPMSLTHLQRLEAESIHIMREVVAEADNPVMLYSIGKDSAVMLHLARKAFYPAPPPFPLLHVDTTWKFRAMYELRDRMAKDSGMDLLVYHNPEAMELGINPFTHGSQIHTDMWKTQGLKQALDKYNFDVAFGGARRDEEKSRAKERIFSFRSAQHRWDPKNQRPELWRLYNGRKHKGESIRCFPISNWTELDIWQYIYLENIPIVPLYYAAERPVVDRDGTLIMVDDERFPLREGEVPMMKSVRFRTLGCYPLSGAVESTASTLTEIIQEMLLTKTSERQGRMIDHDSAASMEKKKQEGYF
ncbi:sulfate adenylyltransferase subunit CysD [Ideonella sp. 3Y2]|uniref:Sulfate adenylyltransferase subunit 2 n=2 Tax=Ideonella alba TaxID=2824118 RepID=A0A940Y2L6_9BURK|nr:sulfate adenylyltransferase subunit CysD [Ideonella alba]